MAYRPLRWETAYGWETGLKPWETAPLVLRDSLISLWVQRTIPQKNKTMHNYNNLQIWQQAMDLVEEIYKLTASFPIEEKFGLVSQMTRAAVSIPSNIAEGAGRNSDKDFAHFISIAIGSLYELNTQIVLSERLGYINQSLSQELQKKLDNLQRKSVSFKSKLNI